jgi:hypothetical protein
MEFIINTISANKSQNCAEAHVQLCTFVHGQYLGNFEHFTELLPISFLCNPDNYISAPAALVNTYWRYKKGISPDTTM